MCIQIFVYVCGNTNKIFVSNYYRQVYSPCINVFYTYYNYFTYFKLTDWFFVDSFYFALSNIPNRI